MVAITSDFSKPKSLITDHVTNTVMKTFEIVQESAEWDPETRNEPMLLEKWQ